MKATKKIVGAACALVAAVALSAGSTFAWFSSNNVAIADGMKVQATVPTNLWIETGYKLDVKTVSKPKITFTDTDAKELNPSAISVDTDGTGIQGDDKHSTDADAAAGDKKVYVFKPATYDEGKDPTDSTSGEVATYTNLGEVEFRASGTPGSTIATAADNYVYKQDMTLANKANDVDVSAKVTLTSTAETETYKFIRVGFIIGTHTTTEGESATTTSTYQFVSKKNDIATATDNAIEFAYDDLITDFGGNTVRTITFLVWFDGDDVDCTVNNALSVSDFAISIEYTATPVDEAAGG